MAGACSSVRSNFLPLLAGGSFSGMIHWGMISYELAYELKEAGFFQGGKGTWTFPRDKLVTRQSDRVYAPTLEELIEACGGDFARLVYVPKADKPYWRAETFGDVE